MSTDLKEVIDLYADTFKKPNYLAFKIATPCTESQ